MIEIESTGLWRLTNDLRKLFKERMFHCKAAFYNMNEEMIKELSREYRFYPSEECILRCMIAFFTAEINQKMALNAGCKCNISKH